MMTLYYCTWLSSVASMKALCGYCLGTLPRAVSEVPCTVTEQARIHVKHGKQILCTIFSYPLLLCAFLCFGLLALFLAFSPPLLGRVVAIATAAVEWRLLIFDLSFLHYFYPDTCKFYLGTSPGCPGVATPLAWLLLGRL